MDHILHMQILIHFIKKNDVINFPGSDINAISENDVDAYENYKLSSLHEKIIEHSQW